jgi:hypothetical protein
MNTYRVVGLWRMRKRFDCVVLDDMQVIQVEQNLWQCLLQKNRLFSFTTSCHGAHVVSNTSKSNVDDSGGNRNRCIETRRVA